MGLVFGLKGTCPASLLQTGCAPAASPRNNSPDARGPGAARGLSTEEPRAAREAQTQSGTREPGRTGAGQLRSDAGGSHRTARGKHEWPCLATAGPRGR